MKARAKNYAENFVRQLKQNVIEIKAKQKWN